jgi:RNA polymerase sigma-70 factor (ECF subfamily)
MPGREESGQARRSVVYCLIPRELARLHELLRRHFRDKPSVEVVVEFRGRERRGGAERRLADVAVAVERRQLRSSTGRRIGERRAVLLPVGAPELPRRARAHTDRLAFVERLEPSARLAEDVDTARLVMRIQGGERDALAMLYMRYFDRVYAYLHLVLRDPHEAEDATQQVFLQAMEALPGYEYRGQPFRAWLFLIARNHALKQLSRLGRVDVTDPFDLSRQLEHDGFERGEPPALEWISDRELLLFIERLPLAQRQVLALRFMLDLTHAQTAQLLGRTPNEVRKLQQRAMRFLRDRLAAVGRQPARRGERPGCRRAPKQVFVLRERRFALR